MKTTLKKMLFFVLLLPLSMFSQSVIKGRVVDSGNAQPLAGVTVAITGTKTATSTDNQGNFTLKNVKNGNTITFSFIGFNSQTITYNGQSSIEVSMVAGDKSIDEIVVIGYGKVKKKDATGSVTQITSKEFNKGAT